MAKARRRPAAIALAKKAETLLRIGPVIQLETPAPSADKPEEKQLGPEIRWIHVASEGTFQGHSYGPFSLTRAVFTSFVANLRKDPQYKRGATGQGEQPVIQFDYEHASESPGSQGSIPVTGAPAPGWVLDLEVRDGADGKAQLWALAKLGEQIRGQIAGNEYRWVSIAWVEESKHPVSGDPTGPRLTSIAFTNQPFLRDLTPLAASRIRASLDYVSAAGSPSEAIEKIRECLQLPATQTPAETLSIIQSVIGWASSPGTAPAGVPVDEILQALRTILGLSVVADIPEIAASANKLLPAAGSVPAAADSPTVAARKTTMNERLMKLLSKGLKRQFSDEDEAADALNQVIKCAVDLAGVLEALGVADAAAALAAVPELMKAKTMLAEATAALEAALAQQAQVEEQMESAEIDAVAATHKMPDSAKVALKLFRKQDLEGFRKAYPLPDAQRQNLLRTLVAGPGDKQVTPPPRQLGIPDDNRDTVVDERPKIDLRAYIGRNATERLCAYLREKDGPHVPFDQLIEKASVLRKTHQLVTE